MKYPEHLTKLISSLTSLPGVGKKTAERYAFSLLNMPSSSLKKMASLIGTLQENVIHCITCGCLQGDDDCIMCDTTKRDTSVICVVATPKDALSIEETHTFKGLYHVLGGQLSPIEGIGPEKLSILGLFQRIQCHETQEVIMALDSTLEGDATAMYLSEQLRSLNTKISRLALGLPMGSPLDYIDGGTLAHALSARSGF